MRPSVQGVMCFILIPIILASVCVGVSDTLIKEIGEEII